MSRANASRLTDFDFHEEEEESSERWLITYADMITLLMVLFVVLYSVSQVDLAKFERLKSGIAGGFGGSTNRQTIIQGGDGILDGGQAAADLPAPTEPAIADLVRRAAEVERNALERLRDILAADLAAAGLSDGVTLRVENRGLIVTIATDRVLFDSGQAVLRPEGREIVHQLAPALIGLPNRLVVEGHTDDVPVSGRYASNWELSTDRAGSVLRELAALGVPVSRLSAGGYADQRPLASNADPLGRATNRRVELVILSSHVEGGV